MRILVLNYEFPPIGGGGGVVSRDLAKKFVEHGHEVCLITMNLNNELSPYEEIDGIKLHRVKCIRKKSGVCHPWEQLTYIFSAISYLKKELSKEKFDVCHTHFIIPTGVIALYLYRKYKLPYVITAHGSDVEGYNQKRFKLMHKLLKPFWKIIVKNSKQIVSPSEYLLDLLRKSDETGNYIVIPNGIDYSYYYKLSEKYEKKKQILVMCRLQEPKGVQTVIKAFAQVALDDWTLHIAGEGPYRKELEALAQHEKAGDRVVFHGWIENKSSFYEKLLGESYLYVTASRFENCPMSVLEAATAGCEMLISDIPAHRQLLAEEEIFFPVDDAVALADKIRNKMCEYGVGDAHRNLKKYDWEEIYKKYEVLMKKSE